MRALIGTAVMLIAACLEYSPHVLPSEERHRDVNHKSIARLMAAPPPERLRFAVVGDTQTAFDEAERVVEALSRRGDLAFVVQIGDFTELGLAPEYERMNDIFRRLPVPYLVVIGNHDHLGNGEDLYERMFGPQDFAFTWARTRFVFLDTNSIEEAYDGTVPDLATLAVNLAPSPDHDRAFVFAHVEPESSDFDSRLRDGFRALLRDGRAVASFHGHEHRFETYVREGIPYFIATHLNDREYLLVSEGDDGGFDVERVTF
jgi:hypothetical protein